MRRLAVFVVSDAALSGSSLMRRSAALAGFAAQRRRNSSQSANEKLGGLATRPRRLQLYTMTG